MLLTMAHLTRFKVPALRLPALSLNVGQWLLAAATLVLLTLHTFVASWVSIDGLSFGLLAMIALATVLPSVVQFTLKIGREGVEASFSRALEHVERVVGADVPVQATPALAEAARSPLASINLSRRALADTLKSLATSAGISLDVGDLAVIASDLQTAGLLTPAEVTAVTRLAASFDEAAKRGDASTSAAVTADLATQILNAKIKQRAAEIVAGRQAQQANG
jgi:hypothetical protein